jgi:hypothetical protein
MLESVWISIKSFLIEETKNKNLVMYHGNDDVVPTVKRGVFVTHDKQIQLSAVERHTKPYHKVEHTITYTP